jgi:hypothetical protein
MIAHKKTDVISGDDSGLTASLIYQLKEFCDRMSSGAGLLHLAHCTTAMNKRGLSGRA